MMRLRIALLHNFVALLVAAFASVAIASDAAFDPRRDAAADVSRAVQAARSEGKRVLIEVGGEWCAWCKIMDRFFAANERVRTLRDAHYVWVKVNWSKENRNEALLSRWPKIEGYPHIFVLDANGALLHSQDTSLLEQGKSYDVGKFVAFLERWRPT